MTAQNVRWTGILLLFAISTLGVVFHPILGLLWFVIWNAGALFVWWVTRVPFGATAPKPEAKPLHKPRRNTPPMSHAEVKARLRRHLAKLREDD